MQLIKFTLVLSVLSNNRPKLAQYVGPILEIYIIFFFENLSRSCEGMRGNRTQSLSTTTLNFFPNQLYYLSFSSIYIISSQFLKLSGRRHQSIRPNFVRRLISIAIHTSVYIGSLLIFLTNLYVDQQF